MSEKFISMFGNDIIEGDLIGFDKTVAKNKVLIYGEVIKLNFDDRTVTIQTIGYKGNPDIDKKKFKEIYVVPEKKSISMVYVK